MEKKDILIRLVTQQQGLLKVKSKKYLHFSRHLTFPHLYGYDIPEKLLTARNPHTSLQPCDTSTGITTCF